MMLDDSPFDLKAVQAGERVAGCGVVGELTKKEQLTAMIRGEAIADKWKVLVYDSHCADIVAPTLRVGELRACNVTLWLRLEQDRQAVPDAPTVYFVSPSDENVRRIARDLQQGLYGEHHINFCGSVSEKQLEDLALASVEAGRVASVQTLQSRQLDFVALESDLFSLNIPDSYVLFNDDAIDEASASRFIAQMVEGLLSVVSTLGRVPQRPPQVPRHARIRCWINTPRT